MRWKLGILSCACLLAGAFTSRAVFRERLGCLVLPDDGPPSPAELPPAEPPRPALLPEIAGPAPVQPTQPRLREAIAMAFGGADGSNLHHTKALLVMHEGRVVGEQYAPGIGQLFLDDGVAGGQRLLPAGWVRYTTTPTPGTGYGAGFWLNSVDGQVPGWGIPWGLLHAPRDSFFARGFLGQFVVVIPSRRLVIVRLGTSQVYTRDGNIAVAMDQWVAAILDALGDGL
ncbi:hypothetical protein [Aquabacterium sp.]|uniref:hypothetical protein n=1 Tax=Aquabacterium sp. TaxID=1872578 RepID=UPI002C88A49B|nr:hypothetical protein [Aquabacterium sp.]HSW07400.1 hypothetical protein [Aquabacterium sp.]